MGIDTVLIDTPAKSGEAGLAAAKVADLVIIPCRPQELDIETLDSVKKILTMADQPPSIVVLNAVPHLGWGRQQEARREISAKGFEVAAPSRICRVASSAAAAVWGLVSVPATNCPVVGPGATCE